MERKAPDMPLLANGILCIPDNARNRLKMSVLEEVPMQINVRCIRGRIENRENVLNAISQMPR